MTKRLLLAGLLVLCAFGMGIASADPTVDEVPGTDNSARAWGDDRYETSLAISQLVWTPDSTYIVFIATGENYPDALALGASTLGMGPILLVKHNEIPTGVEAEVERLEPCAIVVAGGPAAVADTVIQQLDEHADSTSTKCELPSAGDGDGPPVGQFEQFRASHK